MFALALGLVAALAWGIHDICIRYVGRQVGIYRALFLVLTFGTVFLAVVSLTGIVTSHLAPAAMGLAMISGAFFLAGGIGLYRAFAIGPIRLVAPLIAAYPIISMAIAAVLGAPVSALQWAAVLVIITGVGVVAFFSGHDDPQQGRTRFKAIGWSLIGGVGFAFSFAIGQEATQVGDILSVTLITRTVAILGVGVLLAMSGQKFLVPLGDVPLLATMGALDALALTAVLGAGSFAHPEFAAVTSSAFGLVTILIAWAFLKEPMTTTQWVAVFAVFSAIGFLAAYSQPASI